MTHHAPNKLAVCRQLFPKDDEDVTSIKIKEELRRDQDGFKKKYNYDPIEDKPLPGVFVYSFDEVKDLMIGRPSSVDTNQMSSENEKIETKEAVSDVENDTTPKRNQERNESDDSLNVGLNGN